MGMEPERTSIHKEAKARPGVQAFKGRIAVLLGAMFQASKETLCDLAQREAQGLRHVHQHTRPLCGSNAEPSVLPLLPKTPSSVAMPANWRSTVWRIVPFQT